MTLAARLTFLAGVGAIIATLGVGICSTKAQFTAVNAQLRNLSSRIDRLDAKIDRLDSRMDRLENGMDRLRGALILTLACTIDLNAPVGSWWRGDPPDGATLPESCRQARASVRNDD